MGTIVQMMRYPLKGAKPIRETTLRVDTKLGVINDRRFAVRIAPGDISMRPAPFNKLHYMVCANTPQMARQDVLCVEDSTAYEIHPDTVSEVRALVPFGDKLRLQDTHGEYHLGDTSGAQVSFLNLNTLRALEDYTKLNIDPERFRMNVWLEGMPAFAEYAWVDGFPGTREIMVGKVRMRVDDACERRKATHANPATGECDLDMIDLLKRFMGSYRSPQRGVANVMGFYGVVLNDGVLNVGDGVYLL